MLRRVRDLALYVTVDDMPPSSARGTPIQACPHITGVFEVLGRVWTGVILDTLSQRPARFKEMKRAIAGISDRMLSERLHELTDNGLIVRRQLDEGPPYYVRQRTAKLSGQYSIKCEYGGKLARLRRPDLLPLIPMSLNGNDVTRQAVLQQDPDGSDLLALLTRVRDDEKKTQGDSGRPPNWVAFRSRRMACQAASAILRAPRITNRFNQQSERPPQLPANSPSSQEETSRSCGDMLVETFGPWSPRDKRRLPVSSVATCCSADHRNGHIWWLLA